MSLSEVIIRLDIESLEEGGFVATSPDVPGLVAQGSTLGETLDIARDVARRIAESCIEHGDELPVIFRQSYTPGPMAFAVPVAVP